MSDKITGRSPSKKVAERSRSGPSAGLIGDLVGSTAAPAEPGSATDARNTSLSLGEEHARSGAPADAGGPIRQSDAPSRLHLGNRAYLAEPQPFAGRTLDILPDLPDIRDRIYQPHLKPMRQGIYPTIAFSVRDQGKTNSCTGHALAHVIDCLLHLGPAKRPTRVSSRMLYEMAKRNDEWSGTAYEGSSLRGALSGFYRNGVCSLKAAPDDADEADWTLTYRRAKDAREMRLGAYFRIEPDISDYHAALNDIGVIYASAQIHSHWEAPEGGRIKPGGKTVGGHAFAIVGYDEDGFWVLNSWGDGWGEDGLALWLYEDWAATIVDAWVLQLGVRAPSAFSATPRRALSGTLAPKAAAPNRGDIVGHFINIDDGRYVMGGRYGSPTEQEMQETVKRLRSKTSNGKQGFDHLIIYAHGGLNTQDDEANRIATWKRNDIFPRNGIYNFHLMWASGFLDEAFGQLSRTDSGRAGGFLGDLLFETFPGKALGSAAWRNMKQDAVAAFTRGDEYGGGLKGLRPLLQGLDQGSGHRPLLHLVGHSAGSIMLGELLRTIGSFSLKNLKLGSIHLMAPACTTEFFERIYRPFIDGTSKVPLQDKVYLYNLTDQQEDNDTVLSDGLFGYGRSLLYLVSRAYEERPHIKIAGMEIGGLLSKGKLVIDYSGEGKTMSTTHGGFDNDVATLTTIMDRILGHPPKKPPVADELIGY